jgi:ankyrin repeat protein
VLTLVFRAAETGAAAELAALIPQLSVPVDTPNGDGDSALHLVALYGYIECARVLLDQGARAGAADEGGAVPLHDAAAGGFRELVALLLDAAPECLDVGDQDGDTPLHNAARGGHAEVVQLLLDRGADQGAVNADLRTPLALAMPGSEAAQVLQQAAAGQADRGGTPPASATDAET